MTEASETPSMAPVETDIARRSEDWTFLYLLLGFALILEALVIDMLGSGRAPGNFLIYLVLATVTVWMVLYNPVSQRVILGWKTRCLNRTLAGAPSL